MALHCRARLGEPGCWHSGGLVDSVLGGSRAHCSKATHCGIRNPTWNLVPAIASMSGQLHHAAKPLPGSCLIKPPAAGFLSAKNSPVPPIPSHESHSQKETSLVTSTCLPPDRAKPLPCDCDRRDGIPYNPQHLTVSLAPGDLPSKDPVGVSFTLVGFRDHRRLVVLSPP